MSVAAPGAKKNYVPVLDGMRAASILLVLASHLVIFDQKSALAVSLGEACGRTGVTVFFVISGYLITLLLMREEREFGSINLPLFYARRALRIFPAAYTYIFVVILLAGMGVVVGSPMHSYVSSLLYLRNLVGRGHETAHLWSLSLEEQFYVLWPSFLILVAAARRLRVITRIFVCVCVWRAFLVLTAQVDAGDLYIRTDLRIDSILIGCALALLSANETFRRLSEGALSKARAGWATGAGLVAWVLAAPLIPYSAVAEHTVTALIIALMVNWFLRNEGAAVARVLQLPSVLLLGRLSYSIYLWQELFLGPSTPELHFVRRFPLNLILTFAAAALSYRFVEKPFLAIKDRHFGSRARRREGAAPAVEKAREAVTG